MFISKSKLLTMQAQLQQAGVDVSTLQRRLAQVNSAKDFQVDYHKFLTAMRDMDAQQNTGRYVWEGLPGNLTSWIIETMLYWRGSLVGYITGGTLYILPYAQVGDPNLLGMPYAVNPMSYNGVTPDKDGGKQKITLTVNYSGKFDKNASGVLLFDRVPALGIGAGNISRALINRAFTELQADILTRILNNLDAACLKLVFECDDEKKSQVLDEQITNNLAAGKSYVIVRSGTMSGRDGTTYQTGVQLETQTLIECWQSVNSIRCSLSGIRNGGAFEKKERAITAELASDEVQSDMVLDSGLAMRQLFIDQIKAQYPDYKDLLTSIRVRLNQAAEYSIEDADPVTERETVKAGEKEEVKYQ